VTKNYFGEGIAARYDHDNADLSTPEVLGPMIEFFSPRPAYQFTASNSQKPWQNVANHLSSGGYFVIEVLVPMLRSLHPGQNLLANHMSENKWDVDEYSFATQTSTSHHYSVRDGELVRNSVPFRYVWPEELDLMAKLAGMERCQRWGGWNREPFTDDSTFHVSVWQKPLV